ASQGAISATWSVSNASYMRASNSMAVYLSGPNNSGQHFQGYLQNWERSWSKGTDGLGNALQPNVQYTIWIYVYDTDSNSFGVSRSVTFTRPRPPNFNWTTAKTQNAMYNLTAAEYNALLDSINAFRAYKGLVQITFNRTVTSGALPYVTPSA